MTDTEQKTRGSLPHWYKPGYAHFVTYRLKGTIPHGLLREWRNERERLLKQRPSAGTSIAEHRDKLHKQFFSRYDEYLDQSRGVRWLAEDQIAKIVRENLYHHHRTKYELLAWCIMPNHVHVVLQPIEGFDAGSVDHVDDAASVSPFFHSDEIPDSRSPLSKIMHSLKSYTANRANKVLGRSGAFWQRESYDHWIRDADEFERVVNYILWNPVKANMCKIPHEWRFSSAFDRYQQDQSECGLVGRLRDDWRKL